MMTDPASVQRRSPTEVPSLNDIQPKARTVRQSVRAMRSILPLIGFCAACSPASGNPQNSEAATTHTFATQTSAPSPNYRALLDQPVPTFKERRQQDATTPLPSDAKAIGDAWIARLQKRGALLGYGLAGKGPNGPVRLITTGLTEKEFHRWTNENGWRVPTHIRWSFVSEMSLPRVSEAARNAIRVWPASTARTGLQYQALDTGRVELRNGCFFVGKFNQPATKLAWFHAEMGLDIDEAGYFILRDRVTGQTRTRLGEDMIWSGPATAVIDEETERAVQSACGPGEIYVVGSPEASERSMTQYPHTRGPSASPPPPPPPPPPPRSSR